MPAILQPPVASTPEEEKVHALIGEFDSWFRSKGNDPIVRPEFAIIKTFCWFLAHEKNRTKIPGVEGEGT